jgi:hypothetical protein
MSMLEALRWQGAGCAALGSPFSAALLEHAAAALETEDPVRAAFAPWAGASTRSLVADAVALRWLGALHDMVLAEPAGALAATYPAMGRAGDPDLAWPLVLEAMARESGHVAAFMRHEPQTNEVRRSAVLLPGFLTVAAETGLPLRVLELGASAGLNQLWDRRRYVLAPAGEWGPADAAVSIVAEWRGDGHLPFDVALRVAERAACDRAPIDLTDPIARRRLKAYVWPDQIDRLERLDAAIAETLAARVRVEREDAVAWTARDAAPKAGIATVVFHSVFIQYMPAESQVALSETIAGFGARACAACPLAWLRMEPMAANPAVMELRLTLWPDGQDRLLAITHPHGAWIEWRDS